MEESDCASLNPGHSGFDLRSVDLDAEIRGSSTKGEGSYQSGNTASILPPFPPQSAALQTPYCLRLHTLHSIPETQLLEWEGGNLFLLFQLDILHGRGSEAGSCLEYQPWPRTWSVQLSSSSISSSNLSELSKSFSIPLPILYGSRVSVLCAVLSLDRTANSMKSKCSILSAASEFPPLQCLFISRIKLSTFSERMVWWPTGSPTISSCSWEIISLYLCI